MTTITQDHNSAFCHAAGEDRRQLLLQLKQLADQLENCENEVRNGQKRNENSSRSVENVDWGVNTRKEGNGKKSGDWDINKMMKKENGHCCGSGSKGGKVSNNYYDNYKNESNYDNYKNEYIAKYGADKVYGRQYEDKGGYGPMKYKNGKAGMICVYQMGGGLETEQDKEKKKNPDKDTWCGTNRMNVGRNAINAYQMGGGLETEQDKEKRKNPDKDTWCGTNRMNMGGYENQKGINAYQMGGGLETEQDKEKKKNPDKDTWCGTNRMNMGRNGINAYQMGGGLETEQDKEKKKNPDKDTWCGTNRMNMGGYENQRGINAYQMGGGLETEQDKEKKKNPDKDSWCGTNRMNMERYENQRGINAYKMGGGLETEHDKEKKKNPDKDTWCGTNRMNMGGYENQRGINAYQMGGGLETEQDKEKKKNPDKDTWCGTNRMNNDNAYYNGQNQANERIEAMKSGGSKCCVQNNRDTNKFVKNVKKIDQAREKCNEYEINKLIQKSLQQMRNNPKKLGNSCDNVKPLFQNCRPGCQFTIQPQIVFPEYAEKPPYRLEKPAGKCENESTMIAGTVMQGCQCTKRNGLQDQCQSHCHETPTGEKFTVDC